MGDFEKERNWLFLVWEHSDALFRGRHTRVPVRERAKGSLRQSGGETIRLKKNEAYSDGYVRLGFARGDRGGLRWEMLSVMVRLRMPEVRLYASVRFRLCGVSSFGLARLNFYLENSFGRISSVGVVLGPQ